MNIEIDTLKAIFLAAIPIVPSVLLYANTRAKNQLDAENARAKNQIEADETAAASQREAVHTYQELLETIRDDVSRLDRENDELRAEVRTLREANARITTLENENRILAKRLAKAEQENQRLAAIIDTY